MLSQNRGVNRFKKDFNVNYEALEFLIIGVSCLRDAAPFLLTLTDNSFI